MSSLRPLSPKEYAFIDAYLQGMTATKAYIKAGYSQHSADANAARMMAREVIQLEIQRRQAIHRKKMAKTADDVVHAMALIAFTGMSRFIKIDEDGQPIITMENATADDLDLLSEVTVETYMDGKGEDARQVKKIRLKPYSRLDALKVMMQYFGLTTGKKENDGADAMTAMMAEIMHRTSTLPVRVTGPLGSKRSGYLSLIRTPKVIGEIE